MRLHHGPPPAPREWDRRDPDYDDEIVTWAELAVMVPLAVVVVLGFLVFVGLAFAVLAPAP